MLRYAVVTALICGSGIMNGADAGVVSTCTAIDYTTKTSDFTALNNVFDIAVSSGLLASNLGSYDPITVTDKTITVVDFSLLGMNFELTPTINSLNVAGISTIVPKHINVTNATNLDIGADFTGTLSLTVKFTLEIAQLNHKWYQICWTDILHPSTCASTSIVVDVAVGIDQPTLTANLLANMLACPTSSTTATCKPLTINQILVAVLSSDLSGILSRILLRFKSASVSSLSLAFNKLSTLTFTFESSGVFVTQLITALLNFSKDIINKKGDVYNTVIALLNTLGKSLLNTIITDNLAPSFGATCFDNGY